MHETYRMLGREHELDLEREAQRRHLAAALRRAKPLPADPPAELRRQKWAGLIPRLAALLR